MALALALASRGSRPQPVNEHIEQLGSHGARHGPALFTDTVSAAAGGSVIAAVAVARRLSSSTS